MNFISSQLKASASAVRLAPRFGDLGLADPIEAFAEEGLDRFDPSTVIGDRDLLTEGLATVRAGVRNDAAFGSWPPSLPPSSSLTSHSMTRAPTT
jgi:hypothetical protein